MKTATTWEDLVANYEVFVNTDAVPVEAMYDDIKAYAAANKLLFCDTLSALYEAAFG